MNSLTLYQLADEFKATAEKLLEMDLPQEVIDDTLEGERLPIEQKSRNIAALILNIESAAEQKKKAADTMKKRAESDIKLAEKLRKYLLDNLQRCEINRIESPEFSISVKWNPGNVVIDDERQIPIEYMRQPDPPPASPDKAAIKAALKAGQEVPGARIVKTQRLDVK